MGYVEDQIADRRRQLADLDRRRVVLEAELRAFEDVFRHQLAEAAAKTDHPNGNGADDQSQVIMAAFGRMSPEWQNVIRTLRLRQTFRANDMFDVGATQGMILTMPNVRSQLTLLTQRGILRRLAAGEYAVAEEVDVHI